MKGFVMIGLMPVVISGSGGVGLGRRAAFFDVVPDKCESKKGMKKSYLDRGAISPWPKKSQSGFNPTEHSLCLSHTLYLSLSFWVYV